MAKRVLAVGVIHPPFFPDESVRVQETVIAKKVKDKDGKTKEVRDIQLRRIPVKSDVQEL